MKWQMNVADGSKNTMLKAEIVYTTYQIEGIKVTGDGLSIIIQNNRPLLEAIGLKQPLTWKLVEGDVKDQTLLTKIKKEAETYLTNPQKQPAKEIRK